MKRPQSCFPQQHGFWFFRISFGNNILSLQIDQSEPEWESVEVAVLRRINKKIAATNCGKRRLIPFIGIKDKVVIKGNAVSIGLQNGRRGNTTECKNRHDIGISLQY